MTHKTVDIRTDQNPDNGKVTARIWNQKRDNGKNSQLAAVKEDQNYSVKMRRTRFQEEKVSCPICHTLFIKKRPWQRFCSTPCRRKYHRIETRDAILIGMVATARALNYTKDEFISKINAMWE